jgi:hypothetical protein
VCVVPRQPFGSVDTSEAGERTVVGQGESPDEGAETDGAAGKGAAEAGCLRLRPVCGRPGWDAIHGGMVAARGCCGVDSWTKLDAPAPVGGLSRSVTVSARRAGRGVSWNPYSKMAG